MEGLRAGNVTVCVPGPIEVYQERSWGEHWCFHCRKRRTFTFRLKGEIEVSYWGPWPEVSCDVCGTHDGDIFPGCSREWEEV
jgi:hypothetical protein